MNFKTFSFTLKVLCAFLCFATTTFASHIVGGSITYRCLGNDQYEVNVKVYRDCKNGTIQLFFDDPIPLTLFDGQSGAYIRTEPINYSGIDDTTSNYYPDTCFIPTVCLHSTVYTKKITLPYRPSGYTLVYQRCCRSNLIHNVVDPENTGFTLMVEVTPTALTSCNSTPTFDREIQLQVGANDTFEIDASATDINGDSLVYELYAPFSGAAPANPAPNIPSSPPYAPVAYYAPYVFDNPLLGTIDYDANTGILSGAAPTLGTFAIGLSVKEYNSNGELLSTVYQDFKIFVATVPCASTVNVERILNDQEVTVYPNPTYSQLTIELEKAIELTGTLYTATGQTLWSDSFVQNTMIDMEQLPKGIYILQLKTGSEYLIKKIIKE